MMADNKQHDPETFKPHKLPDEENRYAPWKELFEGLTKDEARELQKEIDESQGW